MSTDTPRTDKIRNGIDARYALRSFVVPEDVTDLTNHAHQLERELTAEQEKCKRLREALQMVVSVSDKFCADNNVKIESDCVTNARATLEATK